MRRGRIVGGGLVDSANIARGRVWGLPKWFVSSHDYSTLHNCVNVQSKKVLFVDVFV